MNLIFRGPYSPLCHLLPTVSAFRPVPRFRGRGASYTSSVFHCQLLTFSLTSDAVLPSIMPSDTVFGKRKAQGDQADTVLIVRCIIETHWATETIEIASADALTLPSLFAKVQEALPVTRRHTILGQTFVAPFFCLQDRGMRQMSWNESGNYGRWLKDNVSSGLFSNRRVEVHLRTNAAALQFAIDQQTEEEKDKATWTRPLYTNTGYVPLEKTPVMAAKDHVWKVADADVEDWLEEEMREKLVEVPSTEEWMAVYCETAEAANKKVKGAPAPAPTPAVPAAEKKEEKEPAVEAFEITAEPEEPAEPEDDFWKEYEIDLTLSPATEARIEAEEAERKRKGL